MTSAGPPTAPRFAPAPGRDDTDPAVTLPGHQPTDDRARPGTVDPLALPRAGSSPYPGLPFPLGATPYRDGVNFAVVADGHPGVTDVLLCLVDDQGREQQVTMAERTHGSWHTFVPGITAGQRYGFRVPALDPDKLLLDPYARQVTTTDYDLAAASAPGAGTAGRAPLGIVVPTPSPQVVRPFVPWEQTVVYEAHVAGLTRLHPAVPAELRGTYLGVAHPAVIEHLQRLRVTTLELLPVHATAAEPGLLATGRRNYWGYSTLSYFAPHPGYAATPGREVDEFVAMVDALHQAGIEVVLDVVYNHTCEGGTELPVALSWRGLSPQSYYLRPGHDITGTGNTVDAGQLPAIRMVVDSLRYWAGSLGVDGFRFDLASVLGRPHGGGFDPGAALLTAIATDPLLSTRKLISEPWDATGEGYAVGRFGVQWSEWNDRFRDGVRDFWRGVGGVRDLGYRLSGSSDLYAPDRRPWASVNFVTAHDGFTLRDLVSYDHKHNHANGEDNRDGTDNNRSHNCGVEGPTDDPGIRALRTRQARNLAATLILATGTPMITMGDELWRTQQGNNNAYCQDNEISWMRWPGTGVAGSADGAVPDGGSAADLAVDDTEALDLLAFFRRALDIRHQSPGLRQAEFFDGRSVGSDGRPDLVWFAPDGRTMTDGDWHDGGRQTIAVWINGRDVRGHTVAGQPLTDVSWLLVLHAGAGPCTVVLPGEPYASDYEPVLDTDTPTGVPVPGPAPRPGLPVTIPGRTTWLLRARQSDDARRAGG